MDTSIAGPLAAFNQLYKEMDEIYHRYARAHGLSDTHLWLLYSLRESQCHTQREISALWHASPQTINSALKQLERQGFIALSAMAGNRKNKRVALTQKGRQATEQIIDPLMCAELRALQGLTPQQRQALIASTERYVALLQQEVGKLDAPPAP